MTYSELVTALLADPTDATILQKVEDLEKGLSAEEIKANRTLIEFGVEVDLKQTVAPIASFRKKSALAVAYAVDENDNPITWEVLPNDPKKTLANQRSAIAKAIALNQIDKELAGLLNQGEVTSGEPDFARVVYCGKGRVNIDSEKLAAGDTGTAMLYTIQDDKGRKHTVESDINEKEVPSYGDTVTVWKYDRAGWAPLGGVGNKNKRLIMVKAGLGTAEFKKADLTAESQRKADQKHDAEIAAIKSRTKATSLAD